MARMSHRYPQKLRDRAVRLVADSCDQYESEWSAIDSIATKLGIGSAETLRKWVRKAEIDAGLRPGMTTQESVEVRKLRAGTGSCAEPTRSSRRRRVSSRPSSTGHRGSGGVHRWPCRPQERRRAALGGRADLPGAVRARRADRPQHLLRRDQVAAASVDPNRQTPVRGDLRAGVLRDTS